MYLEKGLDDNLKSHFPLFGREPKKDDKRKPLQIRLTYEHLKKLGRGKIPMRAHKSFYEALRLIIVKVLYEEGLRGTV